LGLVAEQIYLNGGETTHPICASLDHPLSGFAAKRGFSLHTPMTLFINIFNPLSAAGEERVGERSDARVSPCRRSNTLCHIRKIIFKL
jgi:hypothetical protein